MRTNIRRVVLGLASLVTAAGAMLAGVGTVAATPGTASAAAPSAGLVAGHSVIEDGKIGSMSDRALKQDVLPVVWDRPE